MAQWQKKQGKQARALGDLVSGLLNPLVERRAGMTMDLIAVWPDVAGETHALHSRPEKLLWSKTASDDDPFEPATLVVACEGGHALFLQHDSRTIIERVNGYFGFVAVNRLKVNQKTVSQAEAPPRRGAPVLDHERHKKLERILSDVDDPGLRSALAKMGRGVFSEGSS